MSLTRAQWEEMWNSIKSIEDKANSLSINPKRQADILFHVRKIKELIQSVIGQME